MSSPRDPFNPFRPVAPRPADPRAATPATPSVQTVPNAQPASRPLFDPFAARPASGPPTSSSFDPFAGRPATRPGFDTTPAPPLPPAQPTAPSAQPPRTAVVLAPATPLVRTEPEFWSVARVMEFRPALTANELADLTRLVQQRQIQAGAIIVQQGEPADAGAIIGQGQGHMRYDTPGRSPVQFGKLRPGLIVGDGAVSGGGYHGASVLASSGCTVWTFTAGDIARLRSQNPGLFNKLCALVRTQQAG